LLTHFTSPSGYVRYPSWSPRGNRIVFEHQTRSAGIWTVQVR
jgi:Tol biopolymer transport system component